MNDYILTEYSPQYEHALAHHGVKGQKWGVRRYQPYSTTGKRKSGKGGSEVGLAARRAGQAASNVGYAIGRKMRSAGNGLARKMQAHSEAAREKKERKRVLKEEKQKAKYSSSAGQALKNKSKFTTEELKQIKDRLQVEQSLADMKQKDFDRGVKYVKAIAQIATSSYEVGDILSQVATGKKIAEYRKDKIAKDEAAKEAAKEAKDKGGGSSKSETSKTSEHSTTSKTTKDGKKGKKEKKSEEPIFDSKSGTGREGSSDLPGDVSSLRKADVSYRTEHAHDTPTLVFGDKVVSGAKTLAEKTLGDISSAGIKSDRKTDFSSMDPTNNRMAGKTPKTSREIEEYRSLTKPVTGGKSSDISSVVKSLMGVNVAKSSPSDVLASVARSNPKVVKSVLSAVAKVSPKAASGAYDKISDERSPLAKVLDSLHESGSRTTTGDEYSTSGLDTTIGMKRLRYKDYPINDNPYKIYTEDEYRKKKFMHMEKNRGRTIQVYVPDYNGYLAHHGIKGQKWGRRRYQNEDGTLTPAGKQRERSERGTLKAGPVSVDPVRLAGGVARAVKNDIVGRAEANRRMARIDAATNRPVGREKNVTGSAYIGKGPSPSEKHQTQMQNQAGASIADYDYQYEHRYDDIPVQSLNGPFEEQPNYSIAAYDEEQKKKQKQMQTASFGVLAKQLGKTLVDSAKYIASGYVQKIKSSLNKMLSDAISGIKKKVNENRSSRIQVTHDVSITGMRDHAKMGHSEIKMGRTIQVYGPDYSDYLAHHGIKGQKWGVRRFQNPDGSLTDAGRRRQSILEAKHNARKERVGSRYDYEIKKTQERYAGKIAEASAKDEAATAKMTSEWDRVKREGKVTTTKVRNKTFEGTEDKKYLKAKKKAVKTATKLDILKYNQKKDVALLKRLKHYEMDKFSKMTPDEYNKTATRRAIGYIALSTLAPISGQRVARNIGLDDRPTAMPKHERVALERENASEKRKYRKAMTGSYW